MKAMITILVLVQFLCACATSPTGRKQFMMISPEAAIVESQKAYLSTVSELEEKQQLVTDPKLTSRIQTITGRLVKTDGSLAVNPVNGFSPSSKI